MVARGRGKKTAAAAASEAVANGDVILEDVGTTSVVAVEPATAKKGRARGSKKEAAEEEIPVVDDAAVKIPKKIAKTARTTKGSKKSSKAVVEDIAAVEDETKEDDVPVPAIVQKPAVAEKKTSSRKKKADKPEIEAEEVAAPALKKQKTKTKAAQKETVDSAGVPEDPASVTDSASEQTQTNGSKKPTSRKRAAPKADKPAPVESINETDEPDEEIVPPVAKKSSRSKAPKKEAKKPAASKPRGSKKLPKEEDPIEDDILPEDEFVPEKDEEEEEEQLVEPPPKVKKVVKSKGSRKQLKDDIPPVEEEVVSAKIVEETSEKQDSEVESVIEEEKKTKGRKPAATKKPAAAKKVATKKPTKGKKAAKDDPEPESITELAPDSEAVPEAEIKNDEQHADIEPSKGKTNGVAKPKAEPEKKTGRGRKRAATTPIEDADEADGSKNAKPEGLNPTITEFNVSDFSLDKPFKQKISSWNIAGLRSWLKKDGLQYLEYEQPDILCLQEIKCTPDQLPEEARIPGYHPYWLCMPGGHAGVAVYSKIMPINVEYGIGNADHDDDGRMITAEYEKFYLICVYVQNSGRKLVNLEKRLKWEELFRDYVQRLDKIKPVIIAGDMNVAHKEIDLANPKTNTKNAGFTPQERDAMTKLLELGYVDTFRHFHSEDKGAYTFWTYMMKARSKNVGWRLDYFIISERITSKVVESTIRSQVLGSDHCPITLFLNM